jgi:N-acetylmuramoyl-L-alanine amidase
MEDTLVRPSHLSLRHAAVWLSTWVGAACLASLVALVACRPSAPRAGDSGADAAEVANVDRGGGELVARARAAAVAGAPLGERPEVLAMAEGVEALAVREGGGARAAALHELAATVLERAFRRFGREQDGKEATLLFQHASTDLRLDGACASAVRAALLSGEVVHDAAVTYTELYRVQRRLSGLEAKGDAAAPPREALAGNGASACAARLDHELVALAGFRPPARVLEAIDQGLEGEGMLGQAAALLALSSEARVTRIDPIGGAEAARVVIVLSKSAKFRPGDVAVPGMGPPRTYVDLDGVAMGQTPIDFAMSGIVTRVHAEPLSSGTGTRVTLDLDGQAYRKVFYLPEPYRVIIDIARHPPGVAAPAGKRRIERIVLDPGHGGIDPGAIGQAGLKEKDVTLDVARRVAPVLQREGLTVFLTRDDDRFVSLEERTARANAVGADLFVSIHCNAAENRARHGVETYVLDTTRDEIASRVAARENATSQAATAELGAILASLRLADHANHSTHLADLLQRAAMVSLRDGYHDVHDGGVHTAGFYVLVGARMPAILFETSYISNPAEEARLGTDDYKRRLADALANSVRAYREGK